MLFPAHPTVSFEKKNSFLRGNSVKIIFIWFAFLLEFVLVKGDGTLKWINWNRFIDNVFRSFKHGKHVTPSCDHIKAYHQAIMFSLYLSLLSLPFIYCLFWCQLVHKYSFTDNWISDCTCPLLTLSIFIEHYWRSLVDGGKKLNFITINEIGLENFIIERIMVKKFLARLKLCIQELASKKGWKKETIEMTTILQNIPIIMVENNSNNDIRGKK